MKSAKKILEFDFNADVFARRAPQPSKPSQQNLDILKGIVEKHGNADLKPPNQEDLRQIYHLFIQANRDGKLYREFDNRKRIRQLTWALTFSEKNQPRIVDTPQLHDALQLIEERFRISYLPGIFNALLQTWDAPNASMLRAFIKKHLTDYNGSRKFARELKTNMKWYCEENSATQLATELLRSNKKLSDTWSFLELERHEDTHCYRYFGAIAEAFISLNKNINRDVLADVSNFLERHNNDKTSRPVLSGVIEKLGINAPEDLRQPVQSYVLQKWQDPRIVGADVKWHGVSPEARKIFTKWLTEADLEFFFDIVAKACKDQKFAYRKAFWLSYLKHIDFCRPVLRKNVEKLFINDPEARQFYNERRPAILTGGSANMHAFIIQMRGYTFIEFSTGGACYVYDKIDPPFGLDEENYHLSELRRTDLKRNYNTYTLPLKHWQQHNGSEKYSWQGQFAKWLENELGVKPKRSYRLLG